MTSLKKDITSCLFIMILYKKKSSKLRSIKCFLFYRLKSNHAWLFAFSKIVDRRFSAFLDNLKKRQTHISLLLFFNYFFFSCIRRPCMIELDSKWGRTKVLYNGIIVSGFLFTNSFEIIPNCLFAITDMCWSNLKFVENKTTFPLLALF